MSKFLDQIRRAAAIAAQKENNEVLDGVSEAPSAVPNNNRWHPFKPHKPKCRPNEHFPPKGRCNRCGDIFPCPSGNCGHIDCAEAGNGTALPEFVHVANHTIENPLAYSDNRTDDIVPD